MVEGMRLEINNSVKTIIWLLGYSPKKGVA